VNITLDVDSLRLVDLDGQALLELGLRHVKGIGRYVNVMQCRVQDFDCGTGRESEHMGMIFAFLLINTTFHLLAFLISEM
jgi:hypothetical protein